MSIEDLLDQDSRVPRAGAAWAALGAAAVAAAVAVVVTVTVTAGSPDTLPAAQAAPTATTTATGSPAYKVDSLGYINTKARCDSGQTVMAYGRTERSLAVVCVNPGGKLEYRGVRLRDGAAIQVSASRGSDGTVVADNDGVTYSISPAVFLVSQGDNVIYRDPWVEFQQPGFSGATTATSTATTTSGSATPTVSTTAVTVTTSVTATTSKPGN